MTLAVPVRFSRLAGWALPILAVLCCAPSVARGSCGDYVTMRGPHSADVAPTRQDHATEMPAPASPHKPCHGPNCSRGPAVPFLPVPTVTHPVPPEWGWLAGIPAPVPPGRVAFLTHFLSPHPTQLASSVFHPPRSAA